MADQTQHMTFIERYRMHPDIAAALIMWRDARQSSASDVVGVLDRRLAEIVLESIAHYLPAATDPVIARHIPPAPEVRRFIREQRCESCHKWRGNVCCQPRSPSYYTATSAKSWCAFWQAIPPATTVGDSA